jgi:hypothetical protein
VCLETNFHEPLREKNLESYSLSRARSVSVRRYSEIIMYGNDVHSTLLKIVSCTHAKRNKRNRGMSFSGTLTSDCWIPEENICQSRDMRERRRNLPGLRHVSTRMLPEKERTRLRLLKRIVIFPSSTLPRASSETSWRLPHTGQHRHNT